MKAYRFFSAMLLMLPLWLAASVTVARAENPTQAAHLLIPDLQPLPPYELQLELRYGGVEKHLRFSHAIWNRGPGALELHGWYDRFAGSVLVRQLLRSADGSFLNSQTGEFVYHSRHEHWHWDGFSRYEILSVNEDGAPGDLLVSSEKVGFCLRDDERMPGYLLGHAFEAGDVQQPRARFGECGWQKQGLSPGWVDVYGFELDDQSLEITDVPDGVYLLRTLVDPADLLLETDESNNSAQLYFGIYGQRLVVFGLDPPPTYRPGSGVKLPAGKMPGLQIRAGQVF